MVINGIKEPRYHQSRP